MDAWNPKNLPWKLHVECKSSDSDKKIPKFFILSENGKTSYFERKNVFLHDVPVDKWNAVSRTRWKVFASRPKHFAHSFSGNEKEKYLFQKKFFRLKLFLWSRRLQFSHSCQKTFGKKSKCFSINVPKFYEGKSVVKKYLKVLMNT